VNLADLIAPFERSKFINQYWENEPLHIRGRDPKLFHELLSTSALEKILFYCRPRSPDLRVIHEQVELPCSRYERADGALDLNALYKAFDEGSTFIVNGIERFHPPLAELRRDLELDLDFQVVTNAYFSPPNSRGLHAHFDTHDVFVLQIEGEKEWRLFGSAEDLPLLGAFQPVVEDESVGEPVTCVRLCPGDTLYVPRGWLHDARTHTEHSLHLTVGIYPTQWIDLMVEALTLMAASDPQLRRALPIGYLNDPTARAGMGHKADQLAKSFASRAGGDQVVAHVIDHLADRFIKQAWSPPDGHLAVVNATANRITLETEVQKRVGMRCRVIDEANHVSLRFPGGTFRTSREYREALTWIALCEETFTPRELPGGLDAGRQTALVWRLIRGGLLRTH
jgi:ribosomal protein L16 Arg81 hydroxylase